MFWFGRKEKLKRMQGIQVTSKSSLKLQCLFICKGNIKEAKELYDYLVEDMPSLPDFDPQPTTWVDNTKTTVNGLMSWVKENQDTIANIVQLGRSFIGGKGSATNINQPPLPPINS